MPMAPSPAGRRKLFKIAFDLTEEAGDWPPVSVEHLWGEKVDIKYAIKIVNTPFFASEIAYGDIVRVRPDHGRRELVFERLISESGHSAVRVILTGAGVRDEVQELVSAAGCTWESGRFSSLLAIDIPAEADYRALRQSLLGLKSAGKIGLQESAVSNVHRRQFESFP